MGIYEESWRYFALAAAAPAVFCTIFTYFFIPESPIYLATHGRPVHAASIVASLAHRPGCLGHKLKNKGNGTNAFVPGTHKSTNINITAITARGEESNETDQLVTVYSDVENDDEGEDYQVRIHLNQAKHTQAQSEGEEKERGHLHRLPAWADACAKRWRPSLEVRKASYFLRNLQGGRIKQSWRSIKGSVSEMYGGDLLRTSIALQLAWFSLAVSSYGLSVWIPTIYDRVGFEASKYMNVFIFSAAQIPSAVLSFFFIDHPYIGRRGLLIISSIVSAIFTVAFALKHDGPTVAVLFSSLFQMASTVAWNALVCILQQFIPFYFPLQCFNLLLLISWQHYPSCYIHLLRIYTFPPFSSVLSLSPWIHPRSFICASSPLNCRMLLLLNRSPFKFVLLPLLYKQHLAVSVRS